MAIELDNPIAIRITPKEKESGHLTLQHLQTAVIAIHEDGMIVFEDAIDSEHLDTLNDRMVKDVDDLVSRAGTHFNSPGNVSQVPPLRQELMFEDIYANSFAGDVLESILGPHPKLIYLNGNTALVSDLRQDVHADLEWRHPHAPFALTISIYTVDTNLENGSTEWWLGSHRNTSIADHRNAPMEVHKIRPEVVEARRKIRPPIRPEIKKGSLVLRDPKLWHAGMPNHTKVARPCLTMAYSPKWIGNTNRLRIPMELKPVIESFKWNVQFPADYVDCPKGSYDYLGNDFVHQLSPWGGLHWTAEQKEEQIKAWDEKWSSRF